MASTDARASDGTPTGTGTSSHEALPDPKGIQRRLVGGPLLATFTVSLATITPILGGSTTLRKVDTVDVIRAPTIRGHLRFWWRALYGHQCATPRELAVRERALWGGMGGDEGTRSTVDVTVSVEPLGENMVDPSDIEQGAEGAYALWIAREQRSGEPKLPAERYRPGVRFRLVVRMPVEHQPEVENAVRAWILWGGYGSRTRRGLGSLTVTAEEERWLPASSTGTALRQHLPGVMLFGPTSVAPARDTPSVCGARLVHGSDSRDAMRAWFKAVEWLRDFRQQQPPDSESIHEGKFARDRGSPTRPSRSRWPEPDNVRLLLKPPHGKWAHDVRKGKSAKVVWPRSSFGLPVPIRFQEKNRERVPYVQLPQPKSEPEEVELRWEDDKKVRERLASPLVVKAMPLRGGKFVPIALWLHRAWPRGSVVLVRKKKGALPIPGSKAAFDAPIPPEDAALYAPLVDANVRDAFLGWLKKHPRGAKEIL
ncbi:type III-B CRISPR module RAMP protein Cmr1 [Myxococcus sp. K15C18031901]|uniref:type III-B CRISPR module RAMP protein Cmr1 n=1 Tax=Myxococcus dinghuensis TaxID=2906761 RepID=UPI0020A7D357|nr:type III-B CRISPR module RAMP protein Cmr1 [Myxococcus dinghuensis]MCP3103974.1 type III-B CRISPR module RAMP protein Cmr1 [Myxococcus dinghuensis]